MPAALKLKFPLYFRNYSVCGFFPKLPTCMFCSFLAVGPSINRGLTWIIWFTTPTCCITIRNKATILHGSALKTIGGCIEEGSTWNETYIVNVEVRPSNNMCVIVVDLVRLT